MTNILWLLELLPQYTFTHLLIHLSISFLGTSVTVDVGDQLTPLTQVGGVGLSRSVCWLLLSWWLAQGQSQVSEFIISYRLCDFWEREYCYPSGIEQGSIQDGAPATVLTSPETNIGTGESWEINWALLISFDVKLNKIAKLTLHFRVIETNKYSLSLK